MQQIVSQVVSQPWLLASVVGVAALILGLLIPRKSGGTFLSGIIFFLPNLFLDLLDTVHTKKFKYYGLILALLSIEAFFAFRAATVYYDVLSSRMPQIEMAIVCVIVFIAIFLCGFMVATHSGKWNFGRVCTMLLVIIHDWAGTFWITTPDDPLKMLLTIGMCLLGLLPFIMGKWAEELRPELEEEMEEEVNSFTAQATRKIKRRAVERVLRLANHTNVVHLVRALPADEFLDFKAFVMPIIAPGTPYNLPEQTYDAGQHDSQVPSAMAEEKQPENEQDGSQITSTIQEQNQPNESHDSRQHGSQKPVTRAAKKQSDVSQNGAPKSASKTARRDAKIRQFAEEHPEVTHAKLAARFHVSLRTIARALSAQNDMPHPTEMSGQAGSLADGIPARNGHHEKQQQDVNALSNVSITEETVLAYQN